MASRDAAVRVPGERRLERAPGRVGGGDRPHIGSNSVRLVVYDQLGRAPFPRFNEKSLCGLGAGLAETGALAEEAVERTLRAIDRFGAIARAMDVGRIDVFATEAVRRASNGPELVAAIRARSGLAPRVLSGAEEARYSALGVISGFDRPQGLVGDIGGGSLEVTGILDDRVGEDTVSLPLGALPVQAMMAAGMPEAKRQVDAMLKDRLPAAPAGSTFYAVGGGWRALAHVDIAMRSAPIRVVHGYEMETKEARALAKRIARAAPNEVAALPGVPARRVATLPAAALVLERVLKICRPGRVIFSALGLREGWLYAQLAPEEQSRDPLVEGAQAFGAPRSRVPEFSAALVRWTDGLFPDEGPAERRLRHAACALSDFAWRDHVDVRAAESFHRLLQFPFVGVTHAERVFLGATIHARYGGKRNDPALAPATELLAPGEFRRAQVLGRAMLLGHRFSGSVPEILDAARLRIDSEAVRIEVRRSASVPDSDAVRTRLKQFAKAAGLRRTEIREVP